MVPKSSQLQGNSWLKVTSKFLWEMSQEPSAGSASLPLVTWALMLLTITVGSHCGEKLQGYL